MAETTLDYSDSFTLTDWFSGRKQRDFFYEKVLISDHFFYSPYKLPLTTISILEMFTVDSIRIGTITDWQFAPNYKILFNDSTGYATTLWDINVQSYGKISKTSKHWGGEYTVGNWEVQLNDPNGDIWGSLYGAGSEARGKSVLMRAMIQDRPLTYVSQFEGQIQDVTAENGMLTMLIQDKLGGLGDKQFVWDYANIGSANGEHVWGRVKKILGTQVMWDDFGDVEYIERKSPETTFWDTAFGGIIGGVLGVVSSGFTFGASAVLGFAGGALNNLPKNSQVTNAYYKYTDHNAIPDETVASGQKVKFFAGSICAIATNSNSPLKDIQEKVIIGGGFDTESGFYGTFDFADTTGIKVDDWVYVRQPLNFNGSPNDIVKQILCGSNINIPYNAETTYDTYGNLIHNTSFNSSWDTEMNNLELLDLSRSIGVNDEISPIDLLKELFSEIKVNFYIDEDNKFACRTIRPRSFSSSIATYTATTNINNFQYKRSTEDIQNGFILYYDWVGKNGAYNSEYNRKLQLNFKNPIANISKYGTIECKWIHSKEDAQTIAYHVMFDTERGIDKANLDTTLYGVIQNTADLIKVTHPSGNISNRLFEIETYSKDFTSSKVQFSLIDAERIYGYGNCSWVDVFHEISGTSLSGYSSYGQLSGQAGTLGTLSVILNANATVAYLANSESYHNYTGWYCCFGSLPSQYTELVYIEEAHNGTVALKRGMFNTIRRRYAIGDALYSIVAASKDNDGNLTANSLFNKFNLGTVYNMNSAYGTSFKFF